VLIYQSMETRITVAGQQVSLNTRGGAVNDKGTLTGVRVYVAQKAGLTKEEVEKKTFKEVKEMIETQSLATKEEVAGWTKEYNGHRAAHYADSARIGGLFIASPEWRKAFRPSYNKAGDFIGGILTIRKERSKASTLQAQIAAKDAEIAALKARVALLPA
jgi:hypothetical protein